LFPDSPQAAKAFVVFGAASNFQVELAGAKAQWFQEAVAGSKQNQLLIWISLNHSRFKNGWSGYRYHGWTVGQQTMHVVTVSFPTTIKCHCMVIVWCG